MAAFDVFLSYAHADRDRVLEVRDALVAKGLAVWLDDTQIETFESISAAIEQGLACSKVLVAFHSASYPSRRACQWELTAAFIAAQRSGGDPRERVLVVNPEDGVGHIEPVQLRDALFASAPAPGDRARLGELADRVVARVAEIDVAFGALGVAGRPAWVGRHAVGAARFVGRVRDMWQIHSALTVASVGLIAGAHTGDPALKVTGMGGIGKSLLAQEYALRFAASYPGGVFWLRAHGHDDRGDSLTPAARDVDRYTQLRDFARALQISVDGVAADELQGRLAAELDRRGETFLWLVDDLPPGLDSQALEAWFAPGCHGRTLITTRSRAYGAVGAQVHLGVLSLDEAYELLLKHRVPDGRAEEIAARSLVGDLGCHALAVDVAGAGLAAERGARSFAEYRAELKDPASDVLEVAATLADELPDGHEASIVGTLTRSIRQLSEPALDFLRLASRVAADPIPVALVIGVLVQADKLSEDDARNRAVAGMHEAQRVSLAELAEDDGARRVHTLISRTMSLLDGASPGSGAAVAASPRALSRRLSRHARRAVRRFRGGLGGNQARADALAEAATHVLYAELEESVAGRVPADAVTLAHARQLAGEAREVRHALLLLLVAGHHSLRGDHVLAHAQQQKAVAGLQGVLGDEHPDTLLAVNSVAATLHALGDYAGARARFEQTLIVQRRVLGDEHPETLSSMNNLAVTLRALGDHAGARRLHEQILAVRRRVLGEQHSDTLSSMNNLAATLRALGDHAGARPLQEQTLTVLQQELGDEHPTTLQSMNNLAGTLRALGDHAGARALYEHTLSLRRRVLGDAHPYTLSSMNNLAATLSGLGDYAGARWLQEQALAARRRVLGDEHPETLQSMNNLALTLWALGDYAGSRALLEQALTLRRRVLGDEHPDTLASMNNLAETLRALGDHAGARALHEQTLATTRRLLGDEHPDTLTSINNLASTLRALGDHTTPGASHDHDPARELHEDSDRHFEP